MIILTTYPEGDTFKFKILFEISFHVMLSGYVHVHILQNCALEMQPEQQ